MEEEQALQDHPVARRSWKSRIVRGVAVIIFLLFFAAGILVWAIDTGPGHRFIAERVSSLAPSTGLRIHVGRIEGSIWNRLRLRDVRLADPEGIFLEVPELAVDWRPTSWLANRLDIRSLTTDLAILHRVPKLRPSKSKRKAILPDFDVRIDRLAIRKLRVEPAVTGVRRIAGIVGNADIRKGRARISLGVASTAHDRAHLKLDSRPDENIFDVNLAVNAPAKGVIGSVIGTARPIVARVDGKGNWTEWRGHAVADVSGNRVVDLSLKANAGRYQLGGMLAPAPITQGKVQRLSSPRIQIEGDATFAERRLSTKLSLRSQALTTRANGVLDFAQGAIENGTIDIALLKPAAMFPNMTGQNMRLHVKVDGPFATAGFDYVLTAPRVAFDTTGFENVKITGRGNWSKTPISLPVNLVAQRVTGLGDVAGGILRNLRVNGVVKVTPKALTGDGLKLTSDKLQAKLFLIVDLATGKYQVTLNGSLARYLIPGLGVVDVMSELKVVPGANGRGTQVAGRGRVWVRRFDNAFLRSLAGGLPQIDTQLLRGPDGILHFSNLVLIAPDIKIRGAGYRRKDGTFYFKGAGTQQRYGPLDLQLDGNISRPKLDITLARPMDSLGLAGVRLLLDPTAKGFLWRATGDSTLGAFRGDGQIIMRPSAPALISIAGLDVSGTHATGGLRSDPGGFTGKIITAGGGIDGKLIFNPIGDVQRIEAHLVFNRAQLAGVAALRIRRGKLDAVMMLDPAGATIDATVNGRGLRRNQFVLGRLNGSAALRGGSGQIKADLAGSRGRAFSLQTVADLTPNSISLTGQGTVDSLPIRLMTPAMLSRDGQGWQLAKTRLSFSGGTASLAGRFGGSTTEVDASLQRVPLSVFDILVPDLGLGGFATGKFSYRVPRGGRLPVGDADLVIRGLVRSGLVLTSRPIDLGVKAKLTETAAAMRLVALSEGKIIGRAQGRIAPLSNDGSIVDRLQRSPLIAQLRYNGPADTLWRLTGIEAIDLSGPIAVGADVSGALADPRIRGSLRANGARMESGVTGTVIEQIRATGRFGGSTLVIDDFAGTTRGGGNVTGKGRFDLAAVNGFGMNLSVQAENAELLNRDDIGATITGPLTIQSDGSGGVIAGDIKLIKGHFRLGQAAVAQVPQLNVVELNRVDDDDDDVRPRKPWQLDIKADARNRLAVTGLGLDSEWRATLVIKGAVDNPAITGRADLVRGGYEFAGRRFDLERGSIRFLGQTPPDPVLDIAASASIQGLNATINVTGTGLHPDISFQSIPALPQDELLSRLLFGTSITNLSAPEALQLAAAVASLRGGGTGLNPINSVRKAAGLDRLRILPADVTTGQGTSIAAGKYIGRRTYVELITDGQGYSATRVEFQITRWLSLLSSISTIGRQSANVRISKDY